MRIILVDLFGNSIATLVGACPICIQITTTYSIQANGIMCFDNIT